jgi:hypothetical protein
MHQHQLSAFPCFDCQSFENLLSRGVHPGWKSLADHYPIPDRKLFRRLQRLLSALAFWSPIFGEVQYLPALVFPFVRLFEHEDEVVGFELVQTLLLNWARRWFDSWPNPPVALLRQCEIVLSVCLMDSQSHSLNVIFDMDCKV